MGDGGAVRCGRGCAHALAVRPFAAAGRRVARGGAAGRRYAAEAGCPRACPSARAQGAGCVHPARDGERRERVRALLV
eukprot:4699897-Prymnesium_polylepis.1